MSDASSGEAAGPAQSGKTPSDARRKAFRYIAGIMGVSAAAFGLFTAVFGIVAESQKVHAFHNTVIASLLLVLSAPAAITAARDPERSIAPLMHLAVVGVAGLITMVLGFTIDPFTLPFVLLVGVLWALRPSRERQFSFGRPSPILLAMVLVAAMPLIVYALGQAELQRIDSSSEHAELYHWVETSFYAMAVLLLGFLAAVRPAASRASAWSVGLGLAILGGASLALPNYASALDTPWAWAALAGGLAFVALAEWGGRRTTDRVLEPPGSGEGSGAHRVRRG